MIERLTQQRDAVVVQDTNCISQGHDGHAEAQEASTMLYSNSMIKAIAVVFHAEQVAILSEFSSKNTHRVPWAQFVELESVSSKQQNMN